MKAWPHSGFHLDFKRRIQASVLHFMSSCDIPASEFARHQGVADAGDLSVVAEQAQRRGRAKAPAVCTETREMGHLDRKGLEGLLSYFERPPVSLRRLTYRDHDGMVHYQGTKFHPRLGIDHQLLTPLEFLAMLVPHVMLRYEVNTRLYGAISTTRRQKLGWLENPPTGGPPPQGNFESACIPSQQHPFPLVSQPPKPTPIKQDDSQDNSQSEFLRNRKRNWAKLIAKVYQEDPSLCKTCGQPMEIIAAISSPAQDDVIERVLQHLNLWDPPWRRERRARGPPTSHPKQTPFLQGDPDDFDGIAPQINTEDYCVDPPFPDEP
jgi:hypothetical protein